jgi:hypothetical protein
MAKFRLQSISINISLDDEDLVGTVYTLEREQ